MHICLDPFATHLKGTILGQRGSKLVPPSFTPLIWVCFLGDVTRFEAVPKGVQRETLLEATSPFLCPRCVLAPHAESNAPSTPG